MSCVAGLEAQFFSGLFNGLTLGAIYALIALGYSMVYGVLGLINFAHSEVFMIGSFAALGTLVLLGAHAHMDLAAVALLLSLAAVAGIVASGTAAVVLELVAYRPLRMWGAPRHAAMISGMGASIFLQELFALKFGRNTFPFPEVLPSVSLIQIGSGVLTNKMVLILICTVAMLFALDSFVNRTRWGRGIRAVAQEPRAATLNGVDTSTVFLLTFLVGGLCAGLGGFLYGIYYTKTTYIVGFIPGIKALSAAILGGVGNMRGAMVGGLVLGLVENFGVVCIPSQLKDVIAFSLLILVLLFRPTGILGERLAKR